MPLVRLGGHLSKISGGAGALVEGGGMKLSLLANRLLYAGFVLMGIYHLWARGEVMDAAASLGIALIFDPFNRGASSGEPDTPWPQRPAWQRGWLVVHLVGLFGLFAWGMVGIWN